MKRIKPSANKERWPRCGVKTVEARKRDLIVRIANWTRLKDEPAWDVEVYIGGVYDWNESKTFSKSIHGSLVKCKKLAVEFASKQISKLL